MLYQGFDSYSGVLTNPDGKAVVDGKYDFIFSLYDATENGNLLWTENQSGVVVKAGDFTTNLGQTSSLPENIFTKKELWIEVSVHGPGENAFTLLSPRQMISTDAPTETNALTCPHSHFTDYWGGTNSAYGLEVDNGTGTGDGVRAYSASTVQNYAALYAINTAASGYGTAVYGSSSNGNGVYASSGTGDAIEATTSALLANNKSAIYAHATDANGVWAVSTNLFGVHASSINNIGVYGQTSSNDLSNAAGVWGYTGGDGTAVRGLKDGNTGLGVYGTNFGTTGSGVSGVSTNYLGVWGQTDASSNNYGFFTYDNLYSLNYHLAGAVMQVVQNGGTEALEPGDVAVFVGIVAPQDENGVPIIQVAKSTEANSTAVAGVVYSRIDSKVATGGLQADGSGAVGLDLTPAGPVNPGEYLLLVVQGPAQVKVSALSSAIKTGDLLSTAGKAGYLAPATEVTIDSVQIAVPGTILGKALEPLDKGLEDLIYVYVALH